MAHVPTAEVDLRPVAPVFKVRHGKQKDALRLACGARRRYARRTARVPQALLRAPHETRRARKGGARHARGVGEGADALLPHREPQYGGRGRDRNGRLGGLAPRPRAPAHRARRAREGRAVRPPDVGAPTASRALQIKADAPPVASPRTRVAGLNPLPPQTEGMGDGAHGRRVAERRWLLDV